MESNHAPTSHGLLSLRNEDTTSDCSFPLVGHADIIELEMTDISMMWKYWGKNTLLCHSFMSPKDILRGVC